MEIGAGDTVGIHLIMDMEDIDLGLAITATMDLVDLAAITVMEVGVILTTDTETTTDTVDITDMETIMDTEVITDIHIMVMGIVIMGTMDMELNQENTPNRVEENYPMLP